jgi:HSP20 family molecular chaperone IbpA
MYKGPTARVSIPGKIYDLIWSDEDFFRDVSQNKKVLGNNKFPRYDQWCGDDGLHMAFALAGYSLDDVKITATNNCITVSSSDKNDKDSRRPDMSDPESNDEYDIERKPLPSINYGVIVRGIARRSFQTRFVLNEMFDTAKSVATMKDGLLEIVVPKRVEKKPTKIIEVKEG